MAFANGNAPCTIDCSKIILSKRELELLRRLEKEPLHWPGADYKAFDNLYRKMLVTYHNDQPVGRTVRISCFGTDYLLYLDNIKAKERKDNIRYVISTAVAVLTFLIGMLVEHWSGAVEAVLSFLTGG